MHPAIKLLTSLRLTVILLSFSLALVFFGTLDQVNTGIHVTQKRYFESLFVFWQYPDPLPFGDFLGGWFGIPMPGGYTIGILLLINLIAAHIQRFQWTLKKVGIQIVHAGLILLLFSELLTDFLAEESMMSIDESGSSNSAFNSQHGEIYFNRDVDEDHIEVFSIATDYIKNGDVFDEPGLPFTVEILRFYKNSTIGFLSQGGGFAPSMATEGIGKLTGTPRDLGIRGERPTYAMDDVNTESAFIRLTDRETQENLGTWLVSNVLEGNFPAQTMEFGDEQWTIGMRFRRSYFPFALELIDFRFDRYPGTEIPKNFSSEVIIKDPDNGVERNALIYMNHPLRYGGYTFYQASYDETTETTTVLQVVKNPGWLLPYVSVAMLAFGMIWQFSYHLVAFLGKRKPSVAA